MKKILSVLAVVLGAYLIARAIAEPFLIDFGDPATYRADWGGPTLAGVLAVHCGPGILAALAFTFVVLRRRRQAARAPRRSSVGATRTG